MGAKHTRMAPFEFPLHTSVAAYLVDLALTVLVFLCAMTGLEAHPNLSHPPAQRKVMAILGGGLLGWYCFVHLFTPAGLLPGFTSIFICSILPWLAGSIPLLVFPIYRDVVHAVPQTWLTGLHSLRVAGFLYLTLFDIKLLPGGFAVPAGWGGLLVGGLAPVVAHAFGTSSRHAREMGIGFNILGLVEILIELICGFMLLGPFMQHRVDHRLTVRYLWYTMWLIPRYAMPFFVLMHGYSLWKLFTEKEEPFMMWQDEDDEPQISPGVYEIE
eukprot:jgi/Mesen1/9033/ME000565S08334